MAGLVTEALVIDAFNDFSKSCRELGCLGAIAYPPAMVGCGLAMLPALWLIPGLRSRRFFRAGAVRIGFVVLGVLGLAVGIAVLAIT